ncbi:E3 ubiquitin/ISG15 ligase TRIM25-like [Myripristis murdjan]|uniref:E3 ubiquitin/ISG15 ligase TRIM25-like n=1 Tax=Myripristis murdjan TaxID=586833 RepID=UPI00117619DE|nr:E3 ubiquitin/ISG15 ligase TRIM25-like [Myripristis murdjan]
MAQRGIQPDSAKFCCSICLDLLKDPVIIPCGHSYCMSCIKDWWDGEEHMEIYSCPQCRQTFTPRPVLVKNTMLADVVEEMKKMGLQAAPPDLCYAGPGDVACDFCTGRKVKALKSCLVCLASYCEHHLQPHYEIAQLKKHKLVEATVKLQENICANHDEVMKIFCCTDQQCICYLCSMDEHKGHHKVSAAAERKERQKELGVSRQKIQQRIQDREKEVKVLQQEVEEINHSADKAVEDSEEILTELISLIEKRRSDVKQQIRSQQKEEVSRAEEVQQKLKQEIAELRRKDAELEQLSHTEDHTHFLQNHPSLSCLSESTDSPSTNIRPLSYFEVVTAAVSELREKLQDLLSEEWSKISRTVTEVDVLLPQPEPKTRSEFLQYSCHITLDPNTAHRRLSLSEENRNATVMRAEQSYPSHPDRFTERWQVLSRESLTGRCYWEVKWKGRVSIAVSYQDISRTGTVDPCGFGFNDKSWALFCYNMKCYFRHNKIETKIPLPVSSRFQKRREMAQQGIQPDSAKFCCSICLDLLKDPVTIPCGHSYCMSCIKDCWDGEEHKEIYSCPQCRQTFTPRPVLVKSTMLAELLEEMKKTGLQAAPPDLCYAGPGDVACDVCTGRKLKALKSCLVCLASYCEQHLQPHYQSPAFEKHKLVNPFKQLQENICSNHDEVMKIFCRTDQQCICYLCSMDEHKGHHTVSAAAERKERQKELGVSRQKIQQRIQDTEKDVKVLQQEVEEINHSADKAVEDSEEIFTELITLMEKRRSDVKQQIRSQQKEEVSRVEEVQEKLKQEIAELRRKDAELEQLSHTQDHIHFLQNCPSLSCLSESTDSPSTNIRPLSYFEDVTAAVSELREKLQDLLSEEWSKISLTVTGVDVLLPQPEPKTRDEFLQYSCPITLDPNTANTWLSLSERKRKVTRMAKEQSYPSHPDRFIEWCQVLSRESLTGRCYWEMKLKGEVYIAVSYKDISRTGTVDVCGFGYNDKSWALFFYNTKCHFKHNKIETEIPLPVSSRVGVYLDPRAGILSFYSVSETMTLLHRVQTTFTQPLHAGLGLYYHPRFNTTAEFV